MIFSYGTMPDLFLNLESYIQDINLYQAKTLQWQINLIIERMYGLSSFSGAAKSVITHRFVDIGGPRLPVASASPGDIKRTKQIAKDIEILIEQF